MVDGLDDASVQDKIKVAAETRYQRVKLAMGATLTEGSRQREDFSRRLTQRWGKAFDLYETVLALAHDSGAAHNTELRPTAIKDNDIAFDALAQLHARACLVAGEIFTLIKSGYPAAAFGRWRTLHEIVVIALLIKEHGSDLAERYLLHEGIESAKAANIYQQHFARLRRQPIDPAVMISIVARRDALCTKYGPEYRQRYGWASAVLGNPNPDFSMLEKAADMEHLRPFVGHANHQVHSGSSGTAQNMVELRAKTILVAGPSNSGLGEPAHAALISLYQVTCTLLLSPTNAIDIETIATLFALERLVAEAGEAFANAEEALEIEEQAIVAERGES